MPTYDYVCDQCGYEFELFQSIKDKLKRKCPECKKLKLRRLFGTGAAVVFKGSGFYQTDYRSESYKKAAAKEKKAKETAASDKKDSSSKTAGDSKKSDTKPKKSSGDK
jgi:putative FmdB family regulatory protein